MSYIVQKTNSKYPLFGATPSYNQPWNAPLDTDTQNFITATGITSVSIITALDIFVKGLKTDGLWTKMYAIYPFVGGTSTTHKYNLVNPADTNAAYRLTENGTITHTSNGVKATSNGYYSTNLVVSSTFQNNNHHVSYYSRESINPGTGVADIGTRNAFPRLVLWLSFPVGAFIDSNNDVVNLDNNADMFADYLGPRLRALLPDLMKFQTGFWIWTRPAVNTIRVFRNGSIFNQSTSSGQDNFSSLNLPILLFRENTGAGTSQRGCSMVTIGLGLSNTEANNLSKRVNRLQTDLGRNVS